MKIEVVYALPDQQRTVEVELPESATVGDALTAAAPELSDVDLTAAQVGIFGQLCGHERHLEAGDRVEVYRALRVDAKTARRLRAAEQAQRKD